MSPQTLSARRATKRSDLIAAELASYIADLDLEPGTQLASERDMTEQMGVGRTSLREALRLLEARGVLTIKLGVGGGPVVRRPRPSDLREALTLILQFQSTQLVEVLEARRSIELGVCRLAATRITARQVKELRRINAELAAAADPDEVLELNQQFHLAICVASGNMVLRVFLESIVSLADGKAVGIEYGPRQVVLMAQAHERIIDALAAGEADAAGDAMEAHLVESFKYWKRRYAALLAESVRWIQ
jgi:DNA-binding FadR family transcriptional regulator